MSAETIATQADSRRDELLHALNVGEFDRASQLFQAGADINARHEYGDSLLQRVISDWEQPAKRLDVVRFMLDHGADPTLLNDDCSGPFFSAVISQEEEILRLLLEAGADPNRERDDPESLYDWAEFDYRYETYRDEDMHFDLPETPTDKDQENEGAWLEFLDRVAVKHGRPRPTMLRLLRQYGAKTTAELEGHSVVLPPSHGSTTT